MQQHPVFHVSLLQKDRPRDADMLPNETWEAINQQQEPEYEVEYLLDSRGSGEDEEFLVKWHGFRSPAPHGSPSVIWKTARILSGHSDRKEQDSEEEDLNPS